MVASAHGPGRVRLQLALVALASLAVVAYVQSPARGIYGYDGHFHIRYSEWLRHNGVTHTFPWWQETFLKDRYADKDFLFHLMLMPFTFGDLEAGGRAASIVFAVALYVALFLALKAARARAPAAWTIAALLTSTTMLYRAGLMRSVIPAICLALLGTAAILRGSRAGAAICSALYATTHITWQVLPGIALVHDVVLSLASRRPRFASTLASLGGTAAAVLLSPFFPENLRFWYVNNIGVLSMSWSPAAPDLGLGLEILPGRIADLIGYNIGPILFTLAGLALVAGWRRVRSGPDAAGAVTLAVLTSGCLVASILSRRFVEFWAPMSVMFAAAAATRWAAGQPITAGRRRALAAAGVVLLAGLGAWNLVATRRVIGGDPGRLYDGCAGWIRDNAPPAATVFTTDWDEFPELFFIAPRQHYLVGFDPTFMYATDPDRWRLWRDIVEGAVPDIADRIRDTFHARYLFAGVGYEAFIERADQDPWIRAAYGAPDCGVFTIRDADDPPVPGWVGAWRPERGGEAALEAGPRDFIDVTRLPGAASATGCARLRGTLVSPRGGVATFAVSSDDRVALEVGGRRAYDSRDAPPPTLDQAMERHRTGERRRFERTFEAPVEAGANTIVVEDCRVGSAWGFYLRATRLP